MIYTYVNQKNLVGGSNVVPSKYKNLDRYIFVNM